MSPSALFFEENKGEMAAILFQPQRVNLICVLPDWPSGIPQGDLMSGGQALLVPPVINGNKPPWGCWRSSTPDTYHIDGLVQERQNSSVLAMELRLSCINPSP